MKKLEAKAFEFDRNFVKVAYPSHSGRRETPCS